jgi:sugar lactone lactonase YvrE
MATIVTKNSSTPSAVPTTSDLVQGELAVNVADKRIFTENSATQIVELGTNPSVITTATATVTGTLTANGTLASSNAVLTGGTVNGVVIGGSSPLAITGSTVTANTGFVGGLTGNVTGNLTGNVTGNVAGNVTGDLTGNVTASSGTTTLNNLVVNGTADFTNTKLVNITTPTAGTDAANKSYVDATVAAVIDSAPAALDTLNELAAALGDDANFASTVTTALATKLPLAGGTMTGAIAMGTAKITGLGNPTAAQDAATKTYVDTADALKLSLTGGTMSGAIAMGTNKITGLGDPTLAQDSATKSYVDTILGSTETAAASASAAATSASAAATSASNASASATSASNSATSASGSASAASASASSAATSESNASTSETNAAASESAASTSETNAAASEAAASTSETNAASSASSASSSASSASTSASNAASSASSASTSATNAANSATAASGSASAAATSASNAATTYDNFDDRYLGQKASDPTLDNDGDALLTGALYFNTAENKMKVYTGSVWQDVAPVATAVTLSQVTDFPSQTGESGKYLTTNGTVPSWDSVDATLATLTKTFTEDEEYEITLSSNVLTPVVSVTKEVPQLNITNNQWDVSSSSENYTRTDSAYATTLDFVNTGVGATYDSVNFSVSGQGGVPEEVQFKSDGTKMYVIDSQNDAIYQYSLSTAWDLSTASYDSVSFSVFSQETIPTGLFFKPDGTKMYIVGTSLDRVYQYSLSTAWDLSTASYDSVSFSVADRESQPQVIIFKPDGTKMYIIGQTHDAIVEYSLSTAWDLSTASFDLRSPSFATISGLSLFTPTGGAFNSDGTGLYIVDSGTDSITKYNLSTAYDVSSLYYTGIFISVAGEEATPNGLVFKSDFSKLYLIGSSGDEVNQYSVVNGDTLLLGSGSFDTTDIGKTIEANSGVFILTSIAGQYQEITAPSSTTQVASGNWNMYSILYNSLDDDLELSGYITTTYDLVNAVVKTTKAVNGFDSVPEGLRFNNDGTKLFIVGDQNNAVQQWVLPTPYDISTMYFTGVTFSVNSQETVPRGLFFKPDGTKMYVVGGIADTVFQYSLSTAWDLSTASYDSVNYDLVEGVNPEDLFFKPDGTKMYFIDSTFDSVYQYSLSTAWDVSTSSYDSVTFSIASQEVNPQGLTFKPDGTKMYVVGSTSDTVFQYSLSTAWDLSTASYDSVSFVTGMTDNKGLVFDDTGANLYVVASTMTQFTTTNSRYSTGYHAAVTTTSTNTTNWTDLNSMTADQAAGTGNVYYAVSTDDRTTWTVVDNTDGERDIARNNAGTWQYNASGTYTSESWTNATTNTELAAIEESMETVGVADGATGYNVAGGVFAGSFSVASEDTQPSGVFFKPDGIKMYVVGDSGNDVNQYTLSTAWDVMSASFDSVTFSVASQEADPQGLFFKPDGTKMYIVGSASDTVHQYSLSTAWDISTASYDSITFSVASQETAPRDVFFKPDGTKMYICGTVNDIVYQYSLSTAWDLSTASYDSVSFSFTSQETVPQGLFFKPDGTKMYIIGTTGDDVNQYSLSTAWDVSTASFNNIVFSVQSETTSPQGLFFKPDGTTMYITGNSSSSVHQYITASELAYPNQMDKTQLEAVTDPNHFALGNDLDLAIVFNMGYGLTLPSSDGVSINYDGAVKNQGAVLGTDYDFDAPAQNKVNIKSLAANNLKVRVV